MGVRLGYTPDEQSRWEIVKGLIGDQKSISNMLWNGPKTLWNGNKLVLGNTLPQWNSGLKMGGF